MIVYILSYCADCAAAPFLCPFGSSFEHKMLLVLRFHYFRKLYHAIKSGMGADMVTMVTMGVTFSQVVWLIGWELI